MHTHMHVCTHEHTRTHTHTASPCTQSVVPSAGLSRSAWQPGSPSKADQCRHLSQSESHCPPHPPHACTSSGGFGRTVHKTHKNNKEQQNMQTYTKHTVHIMYVCTVRTYICTSVCINGYYINASTHVVLQGPEDSNIKHKYIIATTHCLPIHGMHKQLCVGIL